MAIATHSKPSTCYIISAWQKGKSLPDNVYAHDILIQSISSTLHKGQDYFEMLGTWLGKFEESLLIKNIDDGIARSLAEGCNQEAYFKLENHKHGMYKAYLIETNCGSTFMGYMRSMDKAIIDDLGLDWTYRRDTKQYFTVWPTDTVIWKDFQAEIDTAIAAINFKSA